VKCREMFALQQNILLSSDSRLSPDLVISPPFRLVPVPQTVALHRQFFSTTEVLWNETCFLVMTVNMRLNHPIDETISGVHVNPLQPLHAAMPSFAVFENLFTESQPQHCTEHARACVRRVVATAG
jgi:hypothetical protein